MGRIVVPVSKVLGVGGCDAAKLNGVEIGDIDDCLGIDYTSCGATRWMAGGRLGRVYTTTASNGLNGWGDGKESGGAVVDLGNGHVYSVAYGTNADADDEPVERWVVGLELINGSFGGTAFINSSSVHDGAGIPFYATSSNWTSASVPHGNGYISTQQLAFGNSTWIRGGKVVNDDGDYLNIGTSSVAAKNSSPGGALFRMMDINNSVNDYCRAIAHEGGTSTNWLAVIQSHVWKSENNGATWTDLGALQGTQDWYSIAYDGVGRWVVVGGQGDGWTSIVPVADMEDTDDWDDVSAKIGTSNNMNSLVYMKGSVNKWITCGAGGIIKTTAFTASARGPGDSWATPSTPDTTNMNDIATDNNVAIAVGYSGRIWSSTDAVTWTAANRGDNIGTERLNCIACDIVGGGGRN